MVIPGPRRVIATVVDGFEVSDAGHYLFEDAHERIIPRVREFLQTNPL